MFGHKHRHDHRAPLGVVLAKLALGIAGAVIKNKIANRLSGKPGTHHAGARAADDRDERQGCRPHR
jgi:hypothetical protein